jgi:hypothetical protein
MLVEAFVGGDLGAVFCGVFGDGINGTFGRDFGDVFGSDFSGEFGAVFGRDLDGLFEGSFDGDDPAPMSECHDIMDVRICATGTSGQ